ncbi:unnamed protein product [Didymodactylos carnosus]|uniref:Uncharacterized protein n=1 Tax=Didymodactylos carnosus TaxID=1234261 RepID=A0A813PUQ8_9BILA|nr:unnamed protein product [Didymodactylos carnosus]CAF3533833.1 unnamed protein product [Didymodactylos carnosus]
MKYRTTNCNTMSGLVHALNKRLEYYIRGVKSVHHYFSSKINTVLHLQRHIFNRNNVANKLFRQKLKEQMKEVLFVKQLFQISILSEIRHSENRNFFHRMCSNEIKSSLTLKIIGLESRINQCRDVRNRLKNNVDICQQELHNLKVEVEKQYKDIDFFKNNLFQITESTENVRQNIEQLKRAIIYENKSYKYQAEILNQKHSLVNQIAIPEIKFDKKSCISTIKSVIIDEMQVQSQSTKKIIYFDESRNIHLLNLEMLNKKCKIERQILNILYKNNLRLKLRMSILEDELVRCQSENKQKLKDLDICKQLIKNNNVDISTLHLEVYLYKTFLHSVQSSSTIVITNKMIIAEQQHEWTMCRAIPCLITRSASFQHTTIYHKVPAIEIEKNQQLSKEEETETCQIPDLSVETEQNEWIITKAEKGNFLKIFKLYPADTD